MMCCYTEDCVMQSHYSIISGYFRLHPDITGSIRLLYNSKNEFLLSLICINSA